MQAMPGAQSQRPLVNRILSLEPLLYRQAEFTSIDDALMATNGGSSIAELVEALSGHGIEVSQYTLWRWKREIKG
jgi:hypothetical protein